MGRKLVPKAVRDTNDIRDQLINTLKQKNDYQEQLLAAQDELISELTEEINVLKETLRLVKENQRPEKELNLHARTLGTTINETVQRVGYCICLSRCLYL